MTLPKAVLFDLDETLAESFQPPTPEISMSFESLLSYVPLAIITAAGFDRVKERFLSTLSPSADLSQLYILPDSSAEAFCFKDNVWCKVYDHAFSDAERADIVQTLERIVAEHGWSALKVRGERIISRDSQITVAALGIEALADDKKIFDPDRTKREKVKDELMFLFPDLEVKVGGSTSIDISPKGLDKSHGVLWLAEHLRSTPHDMLYVGDSFHEGGNDFAVIPTGIPWKAVTGPHETEVVLHDLLTQFTQAS